MDWRRDFETVVAGDRFWKGDGHACLCRGNEHVVVCLYQFWIVMSMSRPLALLSSLLHLCLRRLAAWYEIDPHGPGAPGMNSN